MRSVDAVRRGAAIAIGALAIGVAPLAAQHPRAAHQMGWGTGSFLLADVLEYAVAEPALRFDLLGWVGGASRRLWLKSEGHIATTDGAGRAEWQALYGRMVASYWDLQAGAWLDTDFGAGGSPRRGGVALGIHGIAPGWFDVESVLRVSSEGDLGARFASSYDLYLTQRLVVQPRVETRWEAQPVRDLGVGAGFGEVDLALRARYEVRREFAPYVGVVWTGRFGETAALARAAGVDSRTASLVLGVRFWR